jgi:hypothetical protein
MRGPLVPGLVPGINPRISLALLEAECRSPEQAHCCPVKQLPLQRASHDFTSSQHRHARTDAHAA